MKKLLAILLVLVVAIGLMPTVFAADTYSITITTPKYDEATHIYEAYQIFSGDLSTDEDNNVTLSNIVWGSGVDKNNVDYEAIVVAIGGTYNDNTHNSAAAISELLTEENAAAFAKAINAYLNSANAITDTNRVISGLNPGYYLIKDKDNSLSDADRGAYTLYMLQILNKSIVVNSKSDVPTIEKKVDDLNDSNTLENEEEWQDSADYDIDDAVPFKITVKNGSHVSDFETYTLTIHDVQSEGLTAPTSFRVNVENVGEMIFNNDNSTTEGTVNKTFGEGDKAITVSAKITVVFKNPSCSDNCTFHITVTYTAQDANKNSVSIPADINKSKVTVTYSSVLNEDAVIGSDGNPNKTKLDYSNNPNGDEDEKGTTPWDTVIVFTYKIDVSKVDGKTDEPLAGAEFELFKKVVVGANEAKPQGELLDGYYEEKVSGETVYYHWAEFGKIVPTLQDKGDYTGSAEGIDDGVYKLVEIKTPTGYNTIEDIIFTVSATHDVYDENPALTAMTVTPADVFTVNMTTGEVATPTGIISGTVKNNQGSSLPETGGIGTTIFYTVGGILVVAAVILLVTKKRMSAED